MSNPNKMYREQPPPAPTHTPQYYEPPDPEPPSDYDTDGDDK